MSRSATRRHRQLSAVAVLAVFSMCGYVFVAAHASSQGTDLRPAGGDITSVLSDRSRTVEKRQAEAASLQKQIDELTANIDNSRLDAARDAVAELEPVTGFTPVSGPGMRVTLTDAPRSADSPGLDPNMLVVHQQDLQAFVNALWAGGAEAITLQGQRLIATTGIKCVGNTVVLDGVPYSPPYVIEAVGSPSRLRAAMDASPEVVTYTYWAEDYQLGLELETVSNIEAPAYRGSVDLRYAKAVT